MRKYYLFILIGVLLYCSCSNSQKVAEPDIFLDKFAKSHNGEWISKIGSLQLSNSRKLGEGVFNQLPENYSAKIRLIYLDKVLVLPDLRRLNNLIAVNVSFNKLKDITPLAGLQIKEVYVEMCPIIDLSPLAECLELEKLFASGTLIKTIPDFSHLQHLKELRLDQTQITSLDGIEKIDHPFDLYIMQCEQLQDIEALKYSKVQNLYIDKRDPEVYEAKEGTYDRFKEWFRANMAVIKQNNPSFEIKFEIEAGL